MSGASLSTAPTCFYTRIESHLFRLLLLCRLRLLLIVFPSWSPQVVAEGLPLFSEGAAHPLHHAGVPVHADGTARPGAAQLDGVALVSAKRLKERTYPELVGRGARARLVVFAGEVGGRWSGETSKFLRLLAEAKARAEPPILRRRVCFGRPGGCHLVLRYRTGVRLLVAEPSWRARCRW